MTAQYTRIFGLGLNATNRPLRHKDVRSQAGFTMLELFIVIGIIVVLAAMLLPALQRSKSRAQAVFCINNSKHLTLAWAQYTSENEDRFAYNLGGDPGRRSFAPTTSPNWVNNIMDWELSPDNTNTDFVNHSLISPHASFNANIFRCPADRALSQVQKSAGWLNRVRSVSMNAMVGNPGSALQLDGNANANNPRYQQFLKESDVQHPSSIFVFVDEHPDSINDGYFLPGNDDSYQWIDLPASSHNGGATFSFADGHTDIHKWHNESTLRPATPGGAQLPIALHGDEHEDFDWITQHMSVEK